MLSKGPCGRSARYAVGALVLILAAGCNVSPREKPESLQVLPSSPVEIQLAAMQQKATVVPRTLVVEFDQVLTALESRCTETRTTLPGLSEIAVNGVVSENRRGRDITLLEALRTLESSIHEGADMKIDCVSAAAHLFGST
jgi:hypothetical protein